MVVREVELATPKSFKYLNMQRPTSEDLSYQVLSSSPWLWGKLMVRCQEELTKQSNNFFQLCIHLFSSMQIGSLLQFPSLLPHLDLIPYVSLSPQHSASHLPFPSVSFTSFLFPYALFLHNLFVSSLLPKGKNKKPKKTSPNQQRTQLQDQLPFTTTLKITSPAWSIPAPAGCLSCWCRLKHLSGKHHLLFCACSVLREIDFISLSLQAVPH